MSDDRARLMRSTRKLGAVLGTTPQLISSSPPKSTSRSLSVRRQTQFPTTTPSPPQLPPIPRRSSFTIHRHPHIYPNPSASSSSTSISSDASHTPLVSNTPTLISKSSLSLLHPHPKKFTSPRPRPPQLFLQVPAPAPTPAPPSPLSPLTPSTPTRPGATTPRRRKFAKLARTLGEQPPRELVFPDAAPPPPLGRPRRSTSISIAPAPAPAPAPTTVVDAHWEGGWNRGDMRDVMRGLRALRAR